MYMECDVLPRVYRAMRWRPLPPDPAACFLLSRATGLSPVVAQVLYNRGLTTPAAAAAFLTAGRAQILDPFLLKDMDCAVSLIKDRITAGRPIMVYGDYDVDGVTGTAILVLALRALGAQADYYIPDRFSEGYGLNIEALEELQRRGHDFVLSVDTGVSAVAEAAAARRLGMTLVISDHHEPGPELPAAHAVINPKRHDCPYPFKGLSGVGVAFKLALALGAPNAWDLLDIVTLGTIADMVPLVGENRAIVREGLDALGNTRRVGLRALIEVAGLKETVTATHIGYSIGPRINALGRMGSAMLGVELLLTDDPVRGNQLARHLDDQNRSRQDVEATILQEALRQAEGLTPKEREYVLVLSGEGWHHGVVGICATRVLEAYQRPAILLSIDGDTVRGSARSIPSFHMHRALSLVSDLFVKFGGHAAAAGMTLKRREDIPVLRERLNRIAAEWLRPEDLVPELNIDTYVDLDEVSSSLLADLKQLEPNGIGNPAPVLAVRGTTVTDVRTMGKEQQHIRLMLKSASAPFPMEAVGWNMAPARPPMAARGDAAFLPEMDTYQGRNRLRLTLRDLHVDGGSALPSGAGRPAVTENECLHWDPLSGLPAATTARRANGAMVDAREHRLPAALQMLSMAQPEVAATSESETDAPAVEPTRRLYVEALVSAPGRRTLVLTASPWAAAGLADALLTARPDLREQVVLWHAGQPEPAGGSAVLAAYGSRPSGSYSDTVLFHPPYHRGQVPDSRLHLLWCQDDWPLAEATLGWPYPDREVLVQLYKLLKAGGADAPSLARALKEIPGPWNQLRFQSAVEVLREIGVMNSHGVLHERNAAAKFDLQASERFRTGAAGRAALAESQASDWPLPG